MRKNLLILCIALAFSSCKQFKQGEGDMFYKIHEDKDGPLVKDGDFIVFKFIQKTEEDSVLYNSSDYDRPAMTVKQKPGFKGDMFTAIGMLSEGDSATFKINIDSLVGKLGMPKPENVKGKYMLYTFKLDKVIPKGKMKDADFQAKVEQFLKVETDKAKNNEAAKIKNYLDAEDLKPLTTASGLNYVITGGGKGGLKAKPGDTVEVNYTGKFLSGKVFDTSLQDVAKKSGTFAAQRPYKPIKIPVGVGSGIIRGWEEALMLLPKGTKATLILPSKLAYGEQGSAPTIQPFTPLVFDIDIVNIIPGKPGAAAPLPAMPMPAPAVR
ncbi:MAG TPA: FKBP-type peptidyl-prolyl cis-trans isomerase [Sphingobacteriaceae bacterium]|nr:FKBP-type peptidyl-prolyl cis-trans isomerase [Sphingobacteriaceae bacterium]